MKIYFILLNFNFQRKCENNFSFVNINVIKIKNLITYIYIYNISNYSIKCVPKKFLHVTSNYNILLQHVLYLINLLCKFVYKFVYRKILQIYTREKQIQSTQNITKAICIKMLQNCFNTSVRYENAIFK